jgi:CelD/BcsL family acetyltransferase involved in cellulose biosynthesis
MPRFSPGILINGYAIEQSILEGARRFDFLEGEERYKQHWMTRSQENISIWIFRPTWRGRIAALGLKLRNAIIEAARRLLSQEIRLSIRLVLNRTGISI